GRGEAQTMSVAVRTGCKARGEGRTRRTNGTLSECPTGATQQLAPHGAAASANGCKAATERRGRCTRVLRVRSEGANAAADPARRRGETRTISVAVRTGCKAATERRGRCTRVLRVRSKGANAAAGPAQRRGEEMKPL